MSSLVRSKYEKGLPHARSVSQLLLVQYSTYLHIHLPFLPDDTLFIWDSTAAFIAYGQARDRYYLLIFLSSPSPRCCSCWCG